MIMKDCMTAEERVPSNEKWYTCYEDYKGVTLAFKTYDEAMEHAMRSGVFEEICGKDNFEKFQENLFFDVEESELHEHVPYMKLKSVGI